jgi:3-oxoacyl-[acyl-carrier-protein] synthase II
VIVVSMSVASSRRVVITGYGVISPLGNTREQLWEALLAERSGVKRLQRLPAESLPSPFGAECWDFTGHIDDFGPLDKEMKKTIRKGLKVMCREIQMGVAAAQLALVDAKLTPGSFNAERTGVLYGCDYLMTMPEEFSDAIRNTTDAAGFHFEQWGEKGLPKIDPLWLLKFLPNMPASHVAIYNDLRGPNNSLTMREASANAALGEAYLTIARGHADIMLAGATGSRLHPMKTIQISLEEEIAQGENPVQLSRPFDLHRTGSVLGEGAAVLALEELTTAQQRGATIFGEVVGYGSSTVTNSQGVANLELAMTNVLQQALRTSGLTPEQIGHVHAHGLGTPHCDRQEAQAIQHVFQQRQQPVPVVAAKSYFGNLGAAGGAVELLASLAALQAGHLFRTLNYDTPDPACPIQPVTNSTTPAGNNFITLNVTPQGQATALVVQKLA